MLNRNPINDDAWCSAQPRAHGTLTLEASMQHPLQVSTEPLRLRVQRHVCRLRWRLHLLRVLWCAQRAQTRLDYWQDWDPIVRDNIANHVTRLADLARAERLARDMIDQLSVHDTSAGAA